jgi:mycothione reductase
VIVGGGFVACEFAHVFSALGSRVTMMIRGSTLLRGHDDDITMRFTDIAAKKWVITATAGSRASAAMATASSCGAGTARLCGQRAAGRHRRTRNGDLLDAEQAGVKVTASGQVVVDEYTTHVGAWHFRAW